MEGLWEKVRGEFVDVIEWDESSGTAELGPLVWRFDRLDSAIKMGAQLTVRPGQWAVFVNEGRIADGFGPGRYRLETRNLPILTTLLSLPYAFESPFKADVYFVATRQFTDLKWGTRHPVIVRDAELGPVRLRGFGSYTLKVSDPARLIQEVSGSGGRFSVDGITDQLRNLITSRLADLLGSTGHSVLDLASRYDDLAVELQQTLRPELESYGLVLPSLLIETITLPKEVEAAMDRRGAIGLTGDLDAFTTYQRGIALERAADNPSGTAAAAAGLAMGFGLAAPQAPAPPFPAAPAATPPPVPGSSAAPGPPSPAAVEAERLYYHAEAGERQGPFRLADLARMRVEGRLGPQSLLWHDGLSAWTAADAIAAVAPLFRPLSGQPPPPPPPPPPSAPPAAPPG